ncbi:MAG TPA: putative metal-dependent hydrolase [Fimbriiglobus sp.]|jgi:uncharacterized damage-inducible protein DinB
MASPPQNAAGEYVPESNPSAAKRAELVAEIAALPAKVRGLVANLTPAQLDTKYKNWTARQIVHHLSDSHINAYVRFKLALTEDRPTIKPYDESAWAELPDTKSADLALSLPLLEAVHARWVAVIAAMKDTDFARTFIHPEFQKAFSLGETLGLYAWHGQHHAGQIAWLKREKGW